MVDQQHDQVGLGQLLGGAVHHRRRERLGARLGDVRLARGHVGAHRLQALDHGDRRRLAPVGRAGLVAEPEHQHLAAVERLAVLVEQRHGPGDHVVGHVLVDVVGQLDEPERLAEPALHAPRQVRGVDGQAVPADARTGCEPHVAERLGAGGVDGAPDVDAERVGEHRQLVDERDVDVPEGVLEQLDQLGVGGRRHRHDLVDQRSVERLDAPERRLVDARHDLGRVHEAPPRVAGVDALGRVAEEELARLQSRLLEQRTDQLVGGARVRRRLEDHQRTGAQPAGQRRRRVLDVGEVGGAVTQRCRHRDDRHVERADVGRVAHGAVAGVERGPELLVGHVGHVRAAGLEGGGPGGRRLEPDHVEADLDGPHRHGEAHVALAHDQDPGGALVELAQQVGGETVGELDGRGGRARGVGLGTGSGVGHRVASCGAPLVSARSRNQSSVRDRPSAKLTEGP